MYSLARGMVERVGHKYAPLCCKWLRLGIRVLLADVYITGFGPIGAWTRQCKT